MDANESTKIIRKPFKLVFNNEYVLVEEDPEHHKTVYDLAEFIDRRLDSIFDIKDPESNLPFNVLGLLTDKYADIPGDTDLNLLREISEYLLVLTPLEFTAKELSLQNDGFIRLNANTKCYPHCKIESSIVNLKTCPDCGQIMPFPNLFRKEGSCSDKCRRPPLENGKYCADCLRRYNSNVFWNFDHQCKSCFRPWNLDLKDGNCRTCYRASKST